MRHGKSQRGEEVKEKEKCAEKRLCLISVLIVDTISQRNMVNSTGMNKTGAKQNKWRHN